MLVQHQHFLTQKIYPQKIVLIQKFLELPYASKRIWSELNLASLQIELKSHHTICDVNENTIIQKNFSWDQWFQVWVGSTRYMYISVNDNGKSLTQTGLNCVSALLSTRGLWAQSGADRELSYSGINCQGLGNTCLYLLQFNSPLHTVFHCKWENSCIGYGRSALGRIPLLLSQATMFIFKNLYHIARQTSCTSTCWLTLFLPLDLHVCEPACTVRTTGVANC